MKYLQQLMTLWYTGVGSRDTPQHVLILMTAIAYKMAFMGYALRSGGAIGADTAFEQGAGNFKEIFYANDATPEAMAIAGQFHPVWNALRKNGSPVVGDFAKKLHGRNAFQVLGRQLNLPSRYCLCWTADGCNSHVTRQQSTGGTGTAISIAEANSIYVTNLQRPEEFQKWDEWARV